MNTQEAARRSYNKENLWIRGEENQMSADDIYGPEPFQPNNDEPEIFRDGKRANDHNHRLIRSHKGQWMNNPYQRGTPEWYVWQNGYNYRDMMRD